MTSANTLMWDQSPSSPWRGPIQRLAAFREAGLISSLDLQVVSVLGQRVGVDDPDVLLALALAVRAPSRGHICVDLLSPLQAEDASLVESLPELPAGPSWVAKVGGAESLVRGPEDVRLTPFILDGSWLFTDRYWRYQQRLALTVGAWAGEHLDVGDDEREVLGGCLDHLFRPPRRGGVWPHEPAGINLQRVAAAAALTRRFLVVTGGPGMGKTWTVRNLLALIWIQHRLRHRRSGRGSPEPVVALAAPTGKAAQRMKDALVDGLEDQFRASLERCELDIEIDALLGFIRNMEAVTLHRLLGWRGRNPSRFRHNRENPLPVDAVVVDEASMVDFAMMAKLVDAIGEAGPAGGPTRLVLLGDRHQLASVEAGTVLADLCGPTDATTLRLTAGQASRINLHPKLDLARFQGEGGTRVEVVTDPAHDMVVQFNRTWRFHKDSGIGRFAAECLKGDFDAGAATAILDRGPEDGGDVLLVPHEGDHVLPPALEPVVVEGFRPYLERLRSRYPYTTEEQEDLYARVLRELNHFRILCALRHGPHGVIRMNALVEDLLRQEGLVKGSGSWWPGRPVMVLRNDYSVRHLDGRRGLFNGDVGLVVDPTVDGRRRRLVVFPSSGPGVDPEGRRSRVTYVEPARMPEHQTVFAMTIHKSQGSEFDHVLVVLPARESPILTRELVYTGATRARRKMTMVANPDLLREGLGRRVQRASRLGPTLWGEDREG